MIAIDRHLCCRQYPTHFSMPADGTATDTHGWGPTIPVNMFNDLALAMAKAAETLRRFCRRLLRVKTPRGTDTTPTALLRQRYPTGCIKPRPTQKASSYG